ncbi:MAG: ribulose-phosphate 3-epimerase [Candidatus Gracilibacteria bacterium]|jgi:ribulose-phosphate 3-epimerase|nr:ribulose-phosphate 3-epimerase [Candidatus Gracilibacteria bacterium]
MKILVAPSILASDFGRLNEEISTVENAGADLLHIDVMDGVFVPNLSFGLPVCKCINTKLPLDVHLMVKDPSLFIEGFSKLNTLRLYVHFEGNFDLREMLLEIVENGMKAGVVINPETEISSILDVLDVADSVMIMAVKPGFGGQKFQESVLFKIEELRARNSLINIAVDGGINKETSELCRMKGANIMVAGSYIFNSLTRELMIKNLRGE